MTLSIAKGNDPRYYTRDQGLAGHYYTKAIGIEGEPPGLWLGRGCEDLGLEHGAEVDAKVFEELYADWTDPRVMAEARSAAETEISERGLKPEGRAAAELRKQAEERAREEGRLGTAPYEFKPLKERLAEALAKEPYADERRRAEIELAVRKTQRHAVMYYDLTLSMPKSWSLLHAAYQVAGEHEKAAEVWAAIMDGNAAQLEYLQDKAGYTRTGHHTKDIEGRTAGRFMRADRWTVAAFRQHTSRDDDPQLHVHNVVLAKVKTVEVDPVTGEERTVWRAIDGMGIYQHRPAAAAVGHRAAEESLMRRIPGVRVTMRPDGKAREIEGISEELRNEYSSRRRTVTAGVAELAAEYEARHGREPGAHQLAKMAQFVTLESRKAKSAEPPSREQLLSKWERQATSRLRESLSEIPSRVTRRGWRRQAVAEAFDPRQVMATAVEAVQAEKSSWTRADLAEQINRALPDCLGGLSGEQVRALVEELTETAVRPGAGPVEVVSEMPPEPFPLPDELRREDGTSIYSAPGIEKFATAEHLRREDRLIQAGRTQGAPAVAPELVEQVIADAGLKPAQAAAVRGIATSGRQLDVLIGPAGTGKSKTVSVLCEVWEAAGGQVIGVAPSQKAADVLAEEGIDNVANLTKLIDTHERIANGERVSAEDRAAHQIRPNHLVILDESGMAATADMDKVRNLVEAAGGKVLTAGDHRQVSAVGAGGMLAQMAEDLEHAYVLDEVLRFNAEWERDASLKLREGDAAVLLEYDRHGRLRDGSAEEMKERAYRGWLTDHLSGRASLLVAPTNAMAGELAMAAREDLVKLRRVEAEGVPLGCNSEVEQFAGVGDMVALRKNNRRIRDAGDGKHWATNRDVVTVTGRGEDGSLTVQYADGAQMTLPPKYVARHVELAYAGTVHSAQGRTVESCHSLVDDAMSREQLYVALSRGRDDNAAYVICEPIPGMTGEDGQAQVPDRWAVLNGALERTEFEASATTTMRAEFERAENLGVVGRIWEDIGVRHAKQRYAEALAGAVSDEDWQRLYGTESYESLVRLARHVDERGHDGAALLAEVAGARSLLSANDVGATLHDRLEMALRRVEQVKRREAEQAGDPGTRGPGWKTYAERTPQIDGPLGQVMRDAAEVLDARTAELGRRAAEDFPVWAQRLGPVPEDPIERQAWQERAGIVARYREGHGYEVEHDAIGAAPPRGAVEAYAAWEDAFQALGAPEDTHDYARLPDAKLAELVARQERAKEWAPPYVDAELRETTLARDDYRVQAEQARAAAEVEQDPERRAELVEQARAADQFVRLHADRAEKLEQVAAAYDAWHAHTEQEREQGIAAATELDRRRPRTREEAPEAAPEAAREAQPEQGQEHAATAAPSAEEVLYTRYAMARDAGEREMTAVAMADALGIDGVADAITLQESMRARYEAKAAQRQEQAAEQEPAPAVETEPTPEAEATAEKAQPEQGQDAEPTIEPEAAAEAEAEQEPAAVRDVDGEIDQALTTAKAALDHIAEQQRATEREAALEEAQRAADYDQTRRAEQARQAEAEGPQLQM